MGPGSYNPTPLYKNTQQMDRASPQFSNAVVRFPHLLEDQSQARTPTYSIDPVAASGSDLQPLEGPQTTANKVLAGYENNWGSASKKSIVTGSVCRGGHLDKILDPLNVLNHLNQPQLKISDQEYSHNLEYSVRANEQRKDLKNKLRHDLENFIKQEEQMISFNSSSPRFQSQASHLIRVMPGIDTMNGVSLKLRQDKALGPGSYLSPDQLEHRAKLRDLGRNKLPQGGGFGSTVSRQVVQQISKSPFLG